MVTVPAYFTDRQRQAVKEAGKLIDLEVVRIINEPTAAALAYGIGKKLNERVLVYDLGGGTFDVSIIEIRDQRLRGQGHRRRHLPGRHRLRQRDDPPRARRLQGASTASTSPPTRSPCSASRTWPSGSRSTSRRATEAPFSIPFITMTPQGQPLNIEIKFDRKLLEKLTQPLVDRTLKILGAVMVDAGVSAADIDEVMLVGGQTRMPSVQERLTRFFGKPPSKGVHPDEAVAIGAALYGCSLQENSDLKLQLLDVIPMAIGLEQAGGAMHVVFPRNAAIPNAQRHRRPPARWTARPSW